ncbi:MAG: VCBS repeat-containing protein [Phycisphaeraceae bacterium]|nr:VCBS repeat-containing protein [Phycisphaeraceae bacterium]
MSAVRTDLTLVAGLLLRAREANRRFRGAALACVPAAAGFFGAAPAQADDLPTFDTTSFYAAEPILGVGAGDFNNDGLCDIFVWYRNKASPSTIYFNDPANPGTFHNPMSIGFGDIRTFKALDINHDGLIDIVASTSNGFWTIFGNPPGSPDPLQTPTFRNLGTQGYSGLVSFGDFNHDSWPDMVAGPSILLNLAAANPGYFGNQVEVDPAVFSADLSAAGDFNGDGYSDIVFTDVRPNLESALIYINNGDATFHYLETHRKWTAGSEPGRSLLCADFNGDGRSGIALTTSGDASTIYVFLATPGPTGQMTVPVSKGGLASGNNLSVGDFNMDGVVDMVESGSTKAPYPFILMLGCPPPLTGIAFRQLPLPSITDYNCAFAVGDFNGDEKPDIVAVRTSTTAPFAIRILLNTTAIPSVACPADLNNDALVDDADFVIFLAAYNALLCE